MPALLTELLALPAPVLVGGGGVMTLLIAWLAFQFVKTVLKAIALALVLVFLLGGGAWMAAQRQGMAPATPAPPRAKEQTPWP